MTNHSFNPNNTSAEALQRARAVLTGDWDTKPITTVFLPTDAAVRLLDARGWHGDGQRPRGPWTSPSGHREWDTDQALALALTAEALPPTPFDNVEDEHALRAITGAVVVCDPNPYPHFDERITERIVAAGHPPIITAVSFNRLVIASRFGAAPTDLWQRLADHVHDTLPRLASEENRADASR